MLSKLLWLSQSYLFYSCSVWLQLQKSWWFLSESPFLILPVRPLSGAPNPSIQLIFDTFIWRPQKYFRLFVPKIWSSFWVSPLITCPRSCSCQKLGFHLIPFLQPIYYQIVPILSPKYLFGPSFHPPCCLSLGHNLPPDFCNSLPNVPPISSPASSKYSLHYSQGSFYKV